MHTLQTILLVAPILLFSVIAHEIAHGYAALLQGDRTALDAGRLSWNPIRHIDPWFTLILPLMMFTGSSAMGNPMVFGGAKPVPVNPAEYRHIKRGDIIVSLAGVFTNLIIAGLCALLIMLTGLVARATSALDNTLGILQAMFWIGVTLNLGLIFFNLLPIPPLDGSHVMKYLLPRSLAIQYVRFAKYGLLVLIFLLYFGRRWLDFWFAPAYRMMDILLHGLQPFFVAQAAQWLT